jgi:hypothetical protein
MRGGIGKPNETFSVREKQNGFVWTPMTALAVSKYIFTDHVISVGATAVDFTEGCGPWQSSASTNSKTGFRLETFAK